MTTLEKQADGTYKRVPVDTATLIASKEELLIKIYEEIKTLKGE